ncbi:TPA: replication protein [Staphylococcus aureus]|uniref:replication protein n=1 Tax=Staphylococcus aureus TaxID=1280 RepID=UPI0022910947|nr:replication protein [Staphylococcus aureus]HAR5013194.1 replication protein [Staphylococcus aureus]HCV0755807.1 replication protein [Staphylococcus aureus]HCV7034729.1 replication protein [Staphylococcus aureus]HCW7737812.1 replication protein [Staphylococcus aureus]HDA4650161.1 replication protein [Staphylococcus aureus]
MQYNTTRYIDENQDNKTLKDMMKNGKQRPWREKKVLVCQHFFRQFSCVDF